MENIKVNTALMDQTEEQISFHIQKIKTYQSEMIILTAALDSMWTGSAKEEFVEEVQEDLRILGETIDELTSVKAYIEQASREYQKCEEEVRILLEEA